jgi:hypothetical protein
MNRSQPTAQIRQGSSTPTEAETQTLLPNVTLAEQTRELDPYRSRDSDTHLRLHRQGRSTTTEVES